MKTKTSIIETQACNLLKLAGLSVDEIGELGFWGYFYAPASKSRHLAVPGGLMQHSINVTNRLVDLTKTLNLKWPRKESPYLVGMLVVGFIVIRWHMGAFGLAGDELKEYDSALKAFPALLIATHTADMLAANVDEREQRGM